MALQVTKSKVEQLMKKADSLQDKVKRASKKAETIANRFIEMGVSGAAAGSCGYLDGRYGGAELAGLPAPLIVAGLGTVSGLMGLGGAASRYFSAAGQGGSDYYLGSLGASIGRTHAIKAKDLNPVTGKRKGQDGFVAPTDDEVKAALIHGNGTRMLSDAEMRGFAR